MVFVETKRGRCRVARSVLLYASTRGAEIAPVSAKNTSHLVLPALSSCLDLRWPPRWARQVKGQQSSRHSGDVLAMVPLVFGTGSRNSVAAPVGRIRTPEPATNFRPPVLARGRRAVTVLLAATWLGIESP